MSIIRGFLAGFLLLLSVESAFAITLDFVPPNQSVLVGTSVTVDVVVSGLTAAGEIVSAFDLDVMYDPNILNATAVTFGLDLGHPSFFEAFTDFTFPSPGIVDFSELSLLSDSDLAILQGDSVTLATLSFDTVGVGTSALNFVVNPPLNDVKGRNNQVLGITTGNGSVAAAVPEPSTIYSLAPAWQG